MTKKETPKGWLSNNEVLKREFEFADFEQAWAFMNKVAQKAEQLNHHPEWSNSYNKVSIVLTTHSAGGVGSKDYELARDINEIAGKL